MGFAAGFSAGYGAVVQGFKAGTELADLKRKRQQATNEYNRKIDSDNAKVNKNEFDRVNSFIEDNNDEFKNAISVANDKTKSTVERNNARNTINRIKKSSSEFFNNVDFAGSENTVSKFKNKVGSAFESRFGTYQFDDSGQLVSLGEEQDFVLKDAKSGDMLTLRGDASLVKDYKDKHNLGFSKVYNADNTVTFTGNTDDSSNLSYTFEINKSTGDLKEVVDSKGKPLGFRMDRNAISVWNSNNPNNQYKYAEDYTKSVETVGKAKTASSEEHTRQVSVATSATKAQIESKNATFDASQQDIKQEAQRLSNATDLEQKAYARARNKYQEKKKTLDAMSDLSEAKNRNKFVSSTIALKNDKLALDIAETADKWKDREAAEQLVKDMGSLKNYNTSLFSKETKKAFENKFNLIKNSSGSSKIKLAAKFEKEIAEEINRVSIANTKVAGEILKNEDGFLGFFETDVREEAAKAIIALADRVSEAEMLQIKNVMIQANKEDISDFTEKEEVKEVFKEYGIYKKFKTKLLAISK